MKKSTHGGARIGAGRKPASRDADKQLRAVWCWTTPQEQAMINDVLTADERTLILFQCVVAKQNGDNWWNDDKAAASRSNGKRGGRPKKEQVR